MPTGAYTNKARLSLLKDREARLFMVGLSPLRVQELIRGGSDSAGFIWSRPLAVSQAKFRFKVRALSFDQFNQLKACEVGSVLTCTLLRRDRVGSGRKRTPSRSKRICWTADTGDLKSVSFHFGSWILPYHSSHLLCAGRKAANLGRRNKSETSLGHQRLSMRYSVKDPIDWAGNSAVQRTGGIGRSIVGMFASSTDDKRWPRAWKRL